MINFEKLERRLRVLSKRQNIVKEKNLITYQELIRLNELSKLYPSRYMAECIEGETNGNWDRNTKQVNYNLEIKCHKCGEIYTESNISKDCLISYIYENNILFGAWYFTCPKCKANEKKERLLKNIKYNSPDEKQKRDEIIKHNTQNYIKNYLDPNRSFKPGVKSLIKWNYIINDISNSDEKEIAEYIQDMEYIDFLDTPYWDAVRSKKLFQAYYKCSLCNGNENLQVHHKTYENHGYEHNNLDDLIVLCGNCHSKHHGKGEI